MLGSYAVRRAALSQAGAIVVDSTDELAAAAAVLSLHRLPPKHVPGVGLLTAQAGPALLALDQLKSNGVSVPALATSTLERITKLLPPMTHIANPVDTGRPSPAFGEVLKVLVEDEGIDLVAAYALHEPAALRPTDMLSAAVPGGKPVLFATQGPKHEIEATMAMLRAKGMFVARSPSQLAQAVTVLVNDAAKRAQLENSTANPPSLGIPLCEANDEHAVKQMLQQMGVRVPRGIAASSHAEAYAAFRSLTPPVAVKILSADIAHKTDVGGVQLSIKDESALAIALARIDTIPLPGERRYLLEEMAPPGLELIIGAIRDASFGPTIMVGLGGTQAGGAQGHCHSSCTDNHDRGRRNAQRVASSGLVRRLAWRSTLGQGRRNPHAGSIGRSPVHPCERCRARGEPASCLCRWCDRIGRQNVAGLIEVDYH